MKETRSDSNRQKDHQADIDALRGRIDDIDDQILELIGRRLAAAEAIGQLKKQAGIRVIDNRREGQIFQRLLALNAGALKSGTLYGIFRSLICASRGIQSPKGDAGETPIYAVFGDPVGHSLSPVMHNSALAQCGLDGFYLAFRVKDIAAAVNGIRGLGIRGASITIPHKISVMTYLDRLDTAAVEIGAVNTVVNRRGILHGYNSDCSGVINSLREKTTIDGKAVAIIGAGGAARAAAFGIKHEGGRLTVINRTPKTGEKLALELGCEFQPLAEVHQLPYHIVLNATSAGMMPHHDSCPLDAALLDSATVVMDLVYNPLKTRLLTEAEKIGCTTVDGLSMFVHQGAVQFELWTGQKAPVDIMRRVVLDELVETWDDENVSVI